MRPGVRRAGLPRLSAGADAGPAARAARRLDTGLLLPETPKSRAGRRTVAFPAELVPEIRWHLERFAEPGEQGLVFVGPQGARLRRSNFGRIWARACAKAGVPGVHFHDLRHTGGTLAERRGVASNATSRRL